jgi:hypothetical protein
LGQLVLEGLLGQPLLEVLSDLLHPLCLLGLLHLSDPLFRGVPSTRLA